MPIISGGAGSGGPVAGTYWPAATQSGVVLDTTTYDNPITGGKMAVLVFPEDTAAFAFAIVGDDYPRLVIGSDLNDAGIALGDGSFDPVGESAYIFLTGGGELGFSNVPVSSVFGRAGAIAAVAGDYMGVVPAALTGAASATRYVGATAFGAPSAGTFAVGDYVIDQSGGVWVCTVAGTPGTWRGMGAGIVVQAENFTGDAVAIANGATTALTWDTPNGTALLNVSTPNAPTVVEAGAYAVTAVVRPNVDLTAGGAFQAALTTPDFSAIQDSPPATVANPRPTVSLAFTTVSATSSAWSATVLNRDGAASRDYRLSRVFVQRLA